MTESDRKSAAMDLMRIIAAFMVVLLHVSATVFNYSYTAGVVFRISAFFNCLSRFSVPLFVMISGALWLNPQKKVDTGRLWKRNIVRMFIVYIVWDLIYAVYNTLAVGKFDRVTFKVNVLNPQYHLWFLPMIIGIYMIIPILRTWTANATEREVAIAVAVFMVFYVLRYTIEEYSYSDVVKAIMTDIRIDTFGLYVGYFVLGYYLAQYGLKSRIKYTVYAIAPVGFVLNLTLCIRRSAATQNPTLSIADSGFLFTTILAVAVFDLVTEYAKRSKKLPVKAGFYQALSKDMFGVYLSHLLVIMLFAGKIVDIMPYEFSIPLATIVTFAVSALGAAVVRRIPFIGRYIC